ncbi:MAG: hypothetical protein ABDH37_06665 [Candidatus Hydrothermales bacterium]
MPSPIKRTNLWILNIGFKSYEFDPLLGKWENLENILGFKYRLLPRKRLIIRDSINKNFLWIGEFGRGIILYEIKTKNVTFFDTYNFFNGNSITVIKPSKDVVWIGTTGGLFYYHRKNKKIIEVENFRKMWINHIEIEEERVWVNGKYIYFPEAKKIFQLSEFKSQAFSECRLIKILKGYKIFIKDNTLIITDRKNNIITSLCNVQEQVIMDKEGNLWFWGGGKLIKFYTKNKFAKRYELNMTISRAVEWKNYLYFQSYDRRLGRINKLTGEVKIYPMLSFRDFVINDYGIWILTDENLIKIGHYEFEKISLPLSEFEKMEKEIWNKKNELMDAISKSENIVEKIKLAAEFYGFCFKYKEIISDPHCEYDILSKLVTIKEEDIKLIIDFINEDIKPLEKEISYYILSTKPLLIGNPTLALKFYNIFKKEFPKSIFHNQILEEDLKKLEKASEELEKIKNKDLPEDEKLWLLGNIFFEGVKVSWNQKEGGWNMEYPFGLFEKLIQKYPKSPWADNAEFIMLKYYEGVFHEGGEINLSCIEQYEKFIKKYPNSELNSEAKLEIAYHYHSYLSSRPGVIPWIKLKEYIDRARILYNEVLSSAVDSSIKKRAERALLEIDKEVDRFSLQLEILSSKGEYFVGDTIIIIFRLHNVGDKIKEIKINPSLPNFGISIYREDDVRSEVPFIKDFSIKLEDKKNITIYPGEFFEEKQNIQELTLNTKEPYGRWSYGKFEIEREGVYKVRGYYRGKEEIVSFNEISFLVKKK